MSSSSDLALHLLLELGVILAVCRPLGLLLRYVHQPPVVGEMLAGVLLGPSLLGVIAPSWQHWLFPQFLTLSTGHGTVRVTHPSLDILYVVGQLGLVVYMFLVGLGFSSEFNRRVLTRAGTVSIGSIVPPLALGGLLGYIVGGNHEFFPSGVASWQAALFLGGALTVTAFPVLARIIDDLAVGGTQVAILALGAAATCDAVAWSLLAVVLASASHTPSIAVRAIGGAIAYVAVMIVAGRPILRYVTARAARPRGVDVNVLAVILVLLMLCAWFTDEIGIYSVFGAFVFGAMIPTGRFATECRRLLEAPVILLLLPVYFVYSGLNTRIDLLAGDGVLILAIVLLAIAVVAKGAGSILACRAAGSTWRDAASVGALMNARGLMELVLANIGLQKGLISPTLFTVIVLMTIVTTLAATPLFQLFYLPNTSIRDLRVDCVSAVSRNESDLA